MILVACDGPLFQNHNSYCTGDDYPHYLPSCDAGKEPRYRAPPAGALLAARLGTEVGAIADMSASKIS